jgi:hypothetical protein
MKSTTSGQVTSPNSAPTSSSSQRGRILGLLIDARGGWVPSPEIAALAQQYNSRLFELRRLNFRIENRVEEVNGTRLSWFRLISGPVQVEPSQSSDDGRTVDPQPIPPKSHPRELEETLPLFPERDLR